ncbi:MAG: hypothetical protein E6K72_00680 [Candidatus Eisenbacteria bacterium]|uniref:Uncharacterized protein n=1 Tax=Eiseniibacteriota bacterium TaxID=2212470 RepID=A0A538T9S6_UNCEI|nr:MAG: hypothetical protein E6K72_00680 [Candidatus Eisenbacteria bacterium]
MIHAYGSPDPPAPRLLEALATRGYAVSAWEAADERATVGQGGAVPRRDSTLVLSSGGAPALAALGVLLGAWREAPGARVLVLSGLGAHPDARAADRGAGAAMGGVRRRTGASGERAPRGTSRVTRPHAHRPASHGERPVLCAVITVSDTRRADVMSLAELKALAREAGPPPSGEHGAWEPPLRELEEHRLAEADAWLEHFSMRVRPIEEQVLQWAA